MYVPVMLGVAPHAESLLTGPWVPDSKNIGVAQAYYNVQTGKMSLCDVRSLCTYQGKQSLTH